MTELHPILLQPVVFGTQCWGCLEGEMGEGCVTAHTQHRRGGSQPPVSERCCLCAVCAPAACIPTACITASRQELSPSHLDWVVLGVTVAEAERSCSVKNISGFEVWNWGNGVRKWAGVLVCLLFFFYLHPLSWQSLFCKPSASLHHSWPQHGGGKGGCDQIRRL